MGVVPLMQCLGMDGMAVWSMLDVNSVGLANACFSRLVRLMNAHGNGGGLPTNLPILSTCSLSFMNDYAPDEHEKT